jgi:hypothetical protein
MTAHPPQPRDENEYNHPAKLGIGIGIELADWQGAHWPCVAASIPMPMPIPTPKCQLFNFINLRGLSEGPPTTEYANDIGFCTLSLVGSLPF